MKKNSIVIAASAIAMIVGVQTVSAEKVDLVSSIVTTNGNCCQETVDKVEALVREYIPDEMYKDFQRSGWTIQVTEGDLNQEYSGNEKEMFSVTDYNQSCIKIEDESAAVRPYILLREFARYLDSAYGDISYTKTFKNEVYDKEKVIFDNTFETNSFNPHELFASAVAIYMGGTEGKDLLEQHCPIIYMMIDNMFFEDVIVM